MKTRPSKGHSRPTRSSPFFAYNSRSAATARLLAAANLERIKAMSPRERDKLIKGFEAIDAKYTKSVSPAAAASSLLHVVMAAAAEWVKEFYPSATSCSLHISVPAGDAPSGSRSAMLPLPVLADCEPAEGGAP